MATQQSTPQASWYEPTLDRLPTPALPPTITAWSRLGLRMIVYGGLVAGLVVAAIGSMLTLGPAVASATGLGGLLVVLLVGVGLIVASPALAKHALARLSATQ